MDQLVGKYFLFLDESGDHGLNRVDSGFPVFLLCGVLFESSMYSQADAAIKHLKNKYWGDRDVILHSRDLRKWQNEFQILISDDVRQMFYQDLNQIMVDSSYTIIADGIQKEEYIKRYGRLSKVYEICLSYIIERAVFCLDDIPTPKKLFIIVEERGKKENLQLKEYFDQVMARGTSYISKERLDRLSINIHFRSKKKNISGLQFADLIAYPLAKYTLNRKRANPNFDLIAPKLYHKNGKIYGLKTFP